MSSKSSRAKRIAVIAGAAVLAVGATGAAFTYWTATGTGTGTASSGDSVDFTVASSAPTGGPLTPGGLTENIAFTVTNPAEGSQTLTTLTVSIANSDGTAWQAVPGCSADDFTVVVETPPAFGDIAAGADVAGSVTITMLDSATDQDACQGVDVPLYFVAA